MELRARMMNVLLLPLFVFAVAFEFGEERVEGDGWKLMILLEMSCCKSQFGQHGSWIGGMMRKGNRTEMVPAESEGGRRCSVGEVVKAGCCCCFSSNRCVAERLKLECLRSTNLKLFKEDGRQRGGTQILAQSLTYQ
ncbi:hypothetical protein RYX36_012258 [Vicia faba]